MGWEPGEVTTYEYDDAGRVVRSVTVREAEFSSWDLAVLMADRENERIPRGRHGLPIAEATDATNQFAYEVEGPTTDWAQKTLDEFEAEYRRKWPKAPHGALLYKVRRRDAT
jgi:hypothetical protein